MTPTRLFLVRHALVEPAARQMLYGDMDVALCAAALASEGPAHRWLAERLPQPARWVVTPLSRTRATAHAIFAAGYPPQRLAEEPDFAEQHLGTWQGMSHAAVTALLREPAHPFWPHGPDERPPGGESIGDLVGRVGPALERLAITHTGEDIVVVAHGGSIRAAVAHAMGLTPGQALRFSVKNLALTRLEKHARGWRVVSVNEAPPEP